MWIRSQDREQLINANGIYASGNEMYAYNTEAEEPIGTYATRERCIEIIDELQARLDALNIAGIHDFLLADAGVTGVYQMPEE